MIAYRRVQPQETPQLQDTPRPSPGSGQLLIKVEGFGLCHTDSGLVRRTKTEWADTQPLFTRGHEVADWVADIGEGFVGLKSGEPVEQSPTLKTRIATLARLDRLMLVGAALKTVPLGLHEVPWGAQFATSLNGGTLNLREVIELARLGRIETLEDRYPLSRVEDGYNDLRNGKNFTAGRY
jgi:D-arabinose 1-dehydrogenase-like Zn-dependent alcohol dehydrogenase